MNANTPLSNDEIVLIALLRMSRRKKAAWYIIPKAKRYKLGMEIRELRRHIDLMTKSIIEADKPEQWTDERKEQERRIRELLEEG